jgi:hypothetical protein
LSHDLGPYVRPRVDELVRDVVPALRKVGGPSRVAPCQVAASAPMRPCLNVRKGSKAERPLRVESGTSAKGGKRTLAARRRRPGRQATIGVRWIGRLSNRSAHRTMHRESDLCSNRSRMIHRSALRGK